MAILDVIMNVLDAAGNIINPRREDGHGSAPTNRTYVNTGLNQPTTPADTQPVSAADLPLPTGAATDTSVQATTTSLGTDGASPPAILGTGVRGWLRSIYDTLKDTLTVQGTVSANQSGTWNINNVAGTVTLPTGAATAAKQLPDNHNVTVSNFPAIQPVSGTVSARDAYTAGEALADQSTNNAVATFTFSAPVQLVYVYGASSGGTNTYRADPFGGTPSASAGVPCPDGVAVAIPITTSSIKVFGPSGAVSVWGFRY